MKRRGTTHWSLQVGAEITRLSVELTPSRPNLARQRGWSPRADVFEGPEFVLARFELPGVLASHVHLHYHSDRHSLTVRGERVEDGRLDAESFTPQLIELECGAFAREVELPPGPLDVSATQTLFENGLLTVAIPKIVSRSGESGGDQ